MLLIVVVRFIPHSCVLFIPSILIDGSRSCYKLGQHYHFLLFLSAYINKIYLTAKYLPTKRRADVEHSRLHSFSALSLKNYNSPYHSYYFSRTIYKHKHSIDLHIYFCIWNRVHSKVGIYSLVRLKDDPFFQPYA